MFRWLLRWEARRTRNALAQVIRGCAALNDAGADLPNFLKAISTTTREEFDTLFSGRFTPPMDDFEVWLFKGPTLVLTGIVRYAGFVAYAYIGTDTMQIELNPSPLFGVTPRARALYEVWYG